jgi:large subunit ribosomal protein L1
MGKTKNVDMSAETVQEPVKKAEVSVPAAETTEVVETAKKTSTKTAKPKTKKIRSKKYKEVSEKVDRNKTYPVKEAVELVKSTSYSKFDGTLEIHIDTSVKNLRGLVTLPFASGKKMKIVAFGKGAGESGADITGDEDNLTEIGKGKINFDVLVTTPEWMPKIARLAKVLGPRGLMPNPKSGTISDDLKKTVAELQGGKTEYKTEAKANVIHLSLGKLKQPDEELIANTKLLINTIGKSRIKKVTLTPTMGPGVKLDIGSI